jgi:hypothetical protein
MRQTLLIATFLALLVGCSGEAHVPADTPLVETPTSPAPAPAPAVDLAEHATAHRYTGMFYRGEIDLLFERFSEEMQEEILPLDQLTALYEHMITHYGTETRVLAVDSKTNGEYRAFVRWAAFDKTEDVIEVQWILRENDVIAGFWIRPAQKTQSGVVTPPPQP